VFDEVLGKFGRMVDGSKCIFVFIKPYRKVSTGLTHIRFVTVGELKSIHP